MLASEHYDEAIRLVKIVTEYSRSNIAGQREHSIVLASLAQVHATLSLGEDHLDTDESDEAQKRFDAEDEEIANLVKE